MEFVGFTEKSPLLKKEEVWGWSVWLGITTAPYFFRRGII